MNISQEGRDDLDDLREKKAINSIKLQTKDFECITAYQCSDIGLAILESIPGVLRNEARLDTNPNPDLNLDPNPDPNPNRYPVDGRWTRLYSTRKASSKSVSGTVRLQAIFETSKPVPS